MKVSSKHFFREYVESNNVQRSAWQFFSFRVNAEEVLDESLGPSIPSDLQVTYWKEDGTEDPQNLAPGYSGGYYTDRGSLGFIS